MVYSYTFTNYGSFDSASNAVTPRPNWPADLANVLISTTPPLSESSFGAVDWNLWKDIGQEFMVKSTINDWIVCQANKGSILEMKPGSIVCENIKNVAEACSGVVPDHVWWWGSGPVLGLNNGTLNLYYRFDGSTDGLVPMHDPCGTGNASNHKKRVLNPGGQICLR